VPPTIGDRLAHILDAIKSIELLLEEHSQTDLANNRHMRMALEREFEIISEASRRIPAKYKTTNEGIDWMRMADLGNRLRHAYDHIDLGILLQISEKDLPPLKRFIEEILSEESGN